MGLQNKLTLLNRLLQGALFYVVQLMLWPVSQLILPNYKYLEHQPPIMYVELGYSM